MQSYLGETNIFDLRVLIIIRTLKTNIFVSKNAFIKNTSLKALTKKLMHVTFTPQPWCAILQSTGLPISKGSPSQYCDSFVGFNATSSRTCSL